jgi:regulation of enolase protein 1 (concanavalin A-like superfamily)
MNRLFTWRWSTVVVALIGGLILAISMFLSKTEVLSAAPAPDDGKSGNQFRFLAHESFDEKLHLDWQPVRHDADHVSLTKNLGKLTITTQQGTIHGDEKAAGEPSAKNLFVMPNPLAKDADFVISTCISDFNPSERYQQAGLLVYDDDDNYVKWDYEFSYIDEGSRAFALVRETKAKPQHDHVTAEEGLKRVWLRLTRRGKNYEYATSTDGKKFTVHGQREWESTPRMVGILAKNGGLAGVKEIDACFDFFEMSAPPPPISPAESK